MAPNRLAPTAKPKIDVTQNTFSLNSDKGRIGSSARCSIFTKATNAPIVRAAKAAEVVDAQSKLRPPRLVSKVNAPRPRVRVMAPHQSILWLTRVPRGLKLAAKPTRASRPKGTLMRKIQCQLACSVNQPPAKGPKIDEVEKTAAKTP